MDPLFVSFQRRMWSADGAVSWRHDTTSEGDFVDAKKVPHWHCHGKEGKERGCVVRVASHWWGGGSGGRMLRRQNGAGCRYFLVYFAGRKYTPIGRSVHTQHTEWEMLKIGLLPLKIESRTKFVWAHNINYGTAHKLNHTHKHK